MSLRWSDDDARLLTRLREQAGLDRATFARRNTLSPAQLAELEEGGQGRFYNDRIKAHTGHTLLRKLGHTAAASAAARAGLLPGADRAAAAEPEAAVDAVPPPPPRPARMSEPVPMPEATPAAPSFLKVAMGVLALAGIGAGLFIATDPDRVPAMPALAAPSDASTSAPVAQAPASTASALDPAPQTEIATAMPAGDVPPMAGSAAGCGPVPQTGLTRATPAGAIRPANYVHLESTRDVSVCVVDATGKPTAAVVGPGEGLSVYGEPPFVVQTAQWNDLRVFFQGMRMHVDLSAPPVALALDPR